MAGQTAAAPDDVLDDILALGGDPVEQYDEGESESPDSEEFAAPEEGEPEEEATQEPEESDIEPGEEEAPEEEAEEAEQVDEEPEQEPADQGNARIRALAQEAKRAQRFRPILDLLEENPDLAREIVGRKLGLVPAERQSQQSVQSQAQPQRPQMSQQELDAYWNKKLQESPAGALAEMLDLKLKAIRQQQDAQAEPVATASFKSVVRSFKSDVRDTDEQWQYYEPYFDALLKTADRNYVMSDPDTTLSALKDLAYGRWANEQRSRAKKARQAAPASARRQNPRTRLATPTSGRSGARVKQTRALTKEEAALAERYGYDLVAPDDEPESAWR